MRSEKDKMLAGELYNPADPVLRKEQEEARRKVRQYNHVLETGAQRLKALKELFGSTGECLHVEPNIRLDYGYNIHVGENFFANFDCTLLDVCEIRFGDNCMLGPNVQIYTATHPLIRMSVMRVKSTQSRLGLEITSGSAAVPSLTQALA